MHSPPPPTSRHGAGVSAPGTKCQPMQMRLQEQLIEGPCPAPDCNQICKCILRRPVRAINSGDKAGRKHGVPGEEEEAGG